MEEAASAIFQMVEVSDPTAIDAGRIESLPSTVRDAVPPGPKLGVDLHDGDHSSPACRRCRSPGERSCCLPIGLSCASASIPDFDFLPQKSPLPRPRLGLTPPLPRLVAAEGLASIGGALDPGRFGPRGQGNEGDRGTRGCEMANQVASLIAPVAWRGDID
jgi:hypothetical protein